MRKGSSIYSEEMLQVSIRFPISMLKKIKAEAKKNQLSVNKQVIKLVRSGFENLESRGKGDSEKPRKTHVDE
jgi:hypothetical protein